MKKGLELQYQEQQEQDKDLRSKALSNDVIQQKYLTSMKPIGKFKNNNFDLLANISETKYVVVKNVLKKIIGMKVTKDSSNKNWDLYWTDNMVLPEHLANMKPHQKINHFPGMFTLSRKNYLARNLTKMAKMFPNQYDFFPKTWVLPSEISELRLFMDHQDTNPVVIAKPQASSQGRGIFLSQNIEDFEYGQHYVVQKYLKNPLIIDGLKFDLRVYVLIVGCDPLRIYVYKQGLARFATEKYNQPKRQNLKDVFMHLTNYAINKVSQKFKFNESKQQMNTGHKRTLSSIAKQLGQKWNGIWKEIKQLITKTLISTQPILAHHYRSCQPQNYANNMCFQILGFDIIIDQFLKPFLLEVNYTPSFTIDTPLDKFIKQSLIHESLILINLTIKQKSQILEIQKKQINQRTLTGKKLRYSKVQRQNIVKLIQLKRDQWQDNHLGNFEKAYPPRKQQSQMQQIYQKLLKYSQQCYENITGANIRRNQKVIIPQISNIPQIQPSRQELKFNNTKQLEKIYKSSIKPIVYRKRKQILGVKAETPLINSKSTVKAVDTNPVNINTDPNATLKAVYNPKIRAKSGNKKYYGNTMTRTFKE